MRKSRREFLKTAAATGTIAAVPAMPATAKHGHLTPGQIVSRFAQLPGDKGSRSHWRRRETRPGGAQRGPDAIRCQRDQDVRALRALRQVDSPDVDASSSTKLVLNSTVWSFGPTFLHPTYRVVSERTTMRR
jgi:hypothetical protein